jgi:hypothetical protein
MQPSVLDRRSASVDATLVGTVVVRVLWTMPWLRERLLDLLTISQRRARARRAVRAVVFFLVA